jgi:phosphoribosylformimino-5-aminoimidazole carboxamide ribotide isomerase
MNFEVMPAIDLREGAVVRLRQGDYARETRYATAPLELAQSYCDAGARWLHVVDLDGARDGGFTQLALMEQLARCGLSVQAGGGVRAAVDVQRLLDAGAARVVVGSIAVRNPRTVMRWLQDFGAELLVLALDARHEGGVWRLPSAGWTQTESVTLDARMEAYAANGAQHVLCTDIARDGMLGGLNIDLYRHLDALAPGMAVQASGGVRDLDDIRAARAAGAAGVILGRALLEGCFSLGEALAC